MKTVLRIISSSIVPSFSNFTLTARHATSKDSSLNGWTMLFEICKSTVNTLTKNQIENQPS